MTTEQYRHKWNLPSDYPMVASNYAAQRSAFAKASGFGQLRTKPVGAVPASADTIEVGCTRASLRCQEQGQEEGGRNVAAGRSETQSPRKVTA
jgi:ROS/MUCR transcriptional regulator protein